MSAHHLTTIVFVLPFGQYKRSNVYVRNKTFFFWVFAFECTLCVTVMTPPRGSDGYASGSTYRNCVVGRFGVKLTSVGSALPFCPFFEVYVAAVLLSLQIWFIFFVCYYYYCNYIYHCFYKRNPTPLLFIVLERSFANMVVLIWCNIFVNCWILNILSRMLNKISFCLITRPICRVYLFSNMSASCRLCKSTWIFPFKEITACAHVF